MKIVFKITFLFFLGSCGPRTGVHNPQQVPPEKETKKTIDPKYLAALQNGKKLFKLNCATCHAAHGDMGIKLNNIKDRLPSPPEKYFIKYVLNSEKLRNAGDAYAIKVWEDCGKASMPVFEGVLTEVEIAQIYLFIAGSGPKP